MPCGRGTTFLGRLFRYTLYAFFIGAGAVVGFYGAIWVILWLIIGGTDGANGTDSALRRSFAKSS